MSKSVFEKIFSGEEQGWTIWENEKFAAILSREPYSEGHTLVLPKENISRGSDIWDLDPEDYKGLMEASYEVAQILRRAFHPERLIIWVRGFEVSHVHLHLIPSKEGVDLISKHRKIMDHPDLEGVYKKIMNG